VSNNRERTVSLKVLFVRTIGFVFVGIALCVCGGSRDSLGFPEYSENQMRQFPAHLGALVNETENALILFIDCSKPWEYSDRFKVCPFSKDDIKASNCKVFKFRTVNSVFCIEKKYRTHPEALGVLTEQCCSPRLGKKGTFPTFPTSRLAPFKL
jgi:hypothetical protein